MAITISDIAKIIKEIQIVYPQWKPGDESLETWYRYCKCAPSFGVLQKALEAHMAKNPKFAPTVAEMRQSIVTLGGGRLKSTTAKYDALTAIERDRYNAFQRGRGLVPVFEVHPSGQRAKAFAPKSYLCKRAGKVLPKIDYCMNLLGPQKVLDTLRSELGLNNLADLPKEMKKQSFAERYKATLQSMIDLADSFQPQVRL